jgi:GNAT superfamily N-acetyltransferase
VTHDHAPLVIRPIQPDDKEGLSAAFERLSEESRYRRFLSPHNRLTKAELRYFTEVDHHDHEALVAIDPGTGEGVGVARFVRARGRGDSAEIAIAVADDWQGRGLGTELLRRLADRAREEGVARFTALALAGNEPMRHLLEGLGAARVVDAGQGAVELSVDLPNEGVGVELPGWLRAAARGALSVPSATAVRVAGVDDADAIGRLMHDFNSEFDAPTPGASALAERIRELLPADEMTVLLAGSGPDGLAVLRFRPALWTRALECYLAELYVVPAERGRGLGRALMQASLDLARGAGADRIEVGTGDDDVAARALYESFGFINREGGPDGPVMYFYERDL